MAKDTNEKDYIEIDPMRLLRALWRRAWVIVLAAIVFGAGMFSYAAFLLKPQYTASAMMYVNNSSISVGSSLRIESSDLIAAQSLVDTYVVILKSRKVLNEVIKEADLTCSYEQLSSSITAQPVKETEVFEVRVTSLDPNEAEKIANTICAVLPEKIEEIVNGAKPTIVDYAVVPSGKSAPNISRYTAIGMIGGGMLSVLILIIMELFDQYIRSEEYLRQTFKDIPILAVIPDLDESSSSKGRYHSYYSGRTKGDYKL